MADTALPDVVVFPQDNDEVAAIVRLCDAARIPVIAFGVGTSLEGHVAALYGGVCIDLSQMNRVLEVNADDLDCRVQAGVTREQLNAELKGTGLFFPIDPGANATLGGMASTRASGTNAVRYGTMRENVLGLTVVTAEGRIVRTGGRARKSSAGYDLTRLYVGAEGHARRHHRSAAAPLWDSRGDLGRGVPVSRPQECGRHGDRRRAARHPGGADRAPRRCTDGRLHPLFEARGLRGQADAVLRVPRDGCRRARAGRKRSSRWRRTTGAAPSSGRRAPEDRSKLWKARHNAYYATLALAPGKQAFATDACVPISRLTDCVMETRADVAATGLVAPIVGHVGDGNFHLTILFDPGDADERARAEDLARRVSLRAIAMGGTCTGEHGIGVHKLDALVAEHGNAIALMQTIKRALDPHNIMNPGKTVPLPGNT